MDAAQKPFAFVPTDLHTHRTTDLQPNDIVCLSREQMRSAVAMPPADAHHYSVAVHPWWTNSDEAAALWEHVERLARQPACVAIGECGLDRLRGAAIETQQQWFERHVALSERIGKPLVIHCVRAYDLLLRLHKTLRPSQTWIVHGFRGKASLAAQLLAAGFSLSYGKNHQPEAYAITPPKRRFVESDDEPVRPQDDWFEPI